MQFGHDTICQVVHLMCLMYHGNSIIVVGDATSSKPMSMSGTAVGNEILTGGDSPVH